MERVTGIEPVWSAWKAGALPLSYTRATNALCSNHGIRQVFFHYCVKITKKEDTFFLWSWHPGLLPLNRHPHFMRASFNGRTRASQAWDVGSIPIARTSLFRKLLFIKACVFVFLRRQHTWQRLETAFQDIVPQAEDMIYPQRSLVPCE